MLICHDGAAEVVFCARAFGAVELSRRSAADGTVVHATLQIGSALLMVHGEVPSFPNQAPPADGSSPVVIYLYVEDADAVLQRALAAGARLTLPAMDAPWGDRVGRVVDAEGHVWNVASQRAPMPSSA